jgi:hypothetical protein
VRNKARPEGSIAEAYISTECLTFCSMYLDDVETRFNREERNADRESDNIESTLSIFKINVSPIGGRKYKHMDIEDRDSAHFYVLNNCEEINHFIE